MEEKIKKEIKKARIELIAQVIFLVILSVLLGLTELWFFSLGHVPLTSKIVVLSLTALMLFAFYTFIQEPYRLWREWKWVSKHPDCWSLIELLFAIQEEKEKINRLDAKIASDGEKLLKLLKKLKKSL